MNGNENKDAIVYETGSHCGKANCYLSIFLKTENQYRLLSGPYILQRYNSKVAILIEELACCDRTNSFDVFLVCLTLSCCYRSLLWRSFQIGDRGYNMVVVSTI